MDIQDKIRAIISEVEFLNKSEIELIIKKTIADTFS